MQPLVRFIQKDYHQLKNQLVEEHYKFPVVIGLCIELYCVPCPIRTHINLDTVSSEGSRYSPEEAAALLAQRWASVFLLLVRLFTLFIGASCRLVFLFLFSFNRRSWACAQIESREKEPKIAFGIYDLLPFSDCLFTF